MAALLAIPLLVAWPLLKFENKSTAYSVAVGLVVLWLLFIGRYIWNLYQKSQQQWLQLDEQAISGSIGGRSFHIAWHDVSAVSQHKEVRRRLMLTTFYFTTKEGVFAVPLDQTFDVVQIWRLIQNFASLGR
jgi:hypothetical protein